MYTRSPDNLKVENGKLVISAIQQSYSSYTSAQINTRYKLDFKYGRFETRMKLTNVVGLQPTFQLYPTYEVYGSWPRSGQIIPMNMEGSNPGTIRGDTFYGMIENGFPHTAQKDYSPYASSDTRFSTDYHVYAVEWDPTEIRFYVDGYEYFKQGVISNGALPGWFSEGKPIPAPFDQEFFISFSLGVGGDWAGTPIGTWNSPQSIYIDYIRVYQNSTQNITAKATNNPPSSNNANGSNSGGLSMTTIIIIVVVLVSAIVFCIGLKYLYGYMDMDAPMPEILKMKPKTEAASCHGSDTSCADENMTNIKSMEEGESVTDIIVQVPSAPSSQYSKIQQSSMKSSQSQSSKKMPNKTKGLY